MEFVDYFFLGGVFLDYLKLLLEAWHTYQVETLHRVALIGSVGHFDWSFHCNLMS